MNNLNWKREIPSILLLVILFSLYFIGYPYADKFDVNKIPGEVLGKMVQGNVVTIEIDDFAIIPSVALIVYLIFLVAPLIDPSKKNYNLFRSHFDLIRLSILAMISAWYVLIQYNYYHPEANVIRAFPSLIGFLLIIIGNLFGKIRSNWFIGIPTPWTLNSKLSWQKTNRLAGWLFAIFGLILVPSGFISGILAAVLLIVGLILISLILLVFSWRIYVYDQEKHRIEV